MQDSLQFIESLQHWLQGFCPTRQLSPLDIYYAMRWQDSGVPVKRFIDAFNEEIKGKKEDCSYISLKSLSFVAQRTIVKYRSQYANLPKTAPPLEDPFSSILERCAEVGRHCENSLLREELKKAYRDMRNTARTFYGEHGERPQSLEEFYEFKAAALLAWDKILQNLLDAMLEYLSDDERRQIALLTPTQERKIRLLSTQAALEYKLRIKRENLVKYLQIEEIYNILLH
ncbi:MAG: hypothetical protein ACOX8U_09785 [Bradymonadia bacterium]|jgi:hypothetical protein